MPTIRPASNYGSSVAQVAQREALRLTQRRGGIVVSVGNDSCDVLYDGATGITRALPFSGSLIAGQRVEIRDLEGVPTVLPMSGNTGAVFPTFYVHAPLTSIWSWFVIGTGIVGYSHVG